MKVIQVSLICAIVACASAQSMADGDSICCARKRQGNLVPRSMGSIIRLCNTYQCPGDGYHNTEELDQQQCTGGCNVDTCCLTTELHNEYLENKIPKSVITVRQEDAEGNPLVGQVIVTNTANAEESFTSKDSENIFKIPTGETNYKIEVLNVDPAYRLIEEQGGDGTVDGTTKKKPNQDRTITFVYELIKYCSSIEDGSCPVGQFIPDPEQACVDNSCNECCVPKLCSEFASCDGRKDHTTGDVECIDNVCSNCCGTCNDGLLDKTEECEYMEEIDKWIVPKGSASGTESGVPEFDFLDATKQCDSDICVITECTALASWQRVCMTNSHFQPTDFTYTLDLPKYDSSLVAVPISSIDYHLVGQVTGDMTIDDARAAGTSGDIVASTVFAASLEFEIAGVLSESVSPKKEEVHLISPGGQLVLSSQAGGYYANDDQKGIVDELNFDMFSGPAGSTQPVTLIGKASTTVGGFGMKFVVNNLAGGSFRIRYKYNWCPTPVAAERETFEDHNDYCLDSPRNEDWAAAAKCGDGVLNLELGEECDYLAGTSETHHCSDACTLEENTCGDGVKWGAEECDYTIEGSNVEDDFGVYPPPANSRCRKTTDEPASGSPCTVEQTVCGDGAITDNEECEYVAGERGGLLAADEGKAYCLVTCELEPIADCTTKRVPLCDCDTKIMYSTYVQTADASMYGNPICLDNYGYELTFSAGVAEGLNEGECECICYNGINDPNEECDIGPEDGSLNSKETCVGCKIVSSYCGDGVVDPLQGEECDRPWSSDPADDRYFEGGTMFCNSKCKLQPVRECEWEETDSDCRCSARDTFNGDIETTYKTLMEAQPSGYLGGCPIEPTYRPCECTCVGEFSQRNDGQVDGKPAICLIDNDDQCVTQMIFRKTSGVGNWCDHLEGDPLAVYVGREGIRSLDGSGYTVADDEKCPASKCQACQESFTEEMCDQPCGQGNVVGIYSIDVAPGPASRFNFGNGKSLRCSHDDSMVGKYAVIPDREPCTGTNSVKTWKRTCTYADNGLTLGSFSFTPIDTFYRGGETLPDHVANADVVAPELTSVSFSSGMTLNANVDITNTGGDAQVFSVELDTSISHLFKETASFIADTLAEIMNQAFAAGPDDTNSIESGGNKVMSFDFEEPAETVVFSPEDDEFASFVGKSKDDVKQLMTLAGGDANVSGGGGNNEVTITGIYGTNFVVEYTYDRCDADSTTTYDNQEANCSADTVVESVVEVPADLDTNIV
ncbi:hypothetical protein SARC_10989 [Sphaeroforma arctica JP610]|uniref:Disintegrin domain-containing protein n=1 Tax=Sphaeroforma arctica JP610 TaxID=667725 RepID=A0A0L0FKG1_9EUKA|nr:hypothetical protein SARC_10989 [Sphaeroforma arctica JP610]KNC76513.1 hypothetical protein SARC_10989 [Sphaeroforma arctica JP610]|eukprot:XP_014150415.1 hypothetical protein SARC_10989 [Sphaeroforma arctica JP610]